MCPKAEQLLGKLKELGYGPDRVVPIAFHVDYFNKPWKDRFSDPAYSSREMAYNTVLKRNDLYFTPMMMVDGRYPMLGSDQPKAQAALKRVAAERPGASIQASLEGSDPRQKTLRARVVPPSGREVMVGVALYEDPVTTEVKSGENEGKTLIERYAVRKFVWERIKAGQARSGVAQSLTFKLDAPAEADPSKCGVAVWVQDWNDGRVYQADSLPWPRSAETKPSVTTSAR
ncbi:MAG: DUF1223 domain-containing protein [Isosphaeraceae bacterium]